MEVSKLCRCCMKAVASWEKENFDARAVDMFCFVTNIKIMEDKKLPKQFCYDCTIKIESCYQFIKEAQNVNITLKNIVSRSETSIIIEPESFKNPEQESSRLKLTLPDYKLSIGLCHFAEQNIVYDIDIGNVHYNENRILNDTIVTQTIHTPASAQNVEKPIENINLNDKLKVEDKNIIEETKQNVCPICRKEFVSKKWFSKHMEKEHSGPRYTCQQCSKTFSKSFQLAYHVTSHSNERKFACITCGKRFKRRKQLTIHTRGHSDVRPYACDKCAMRFKIKSVLKCHLKVHDEVKPFLCSYCGWSFTQANNLEVHLRTHTGAKPHACAQCGFRSAAASSLRRHQRTHTDARGHVCAHCRKGFYDASGLARHVRTHTGELPYSCPACARAFSDSWKRKTHLMRAHRLALGDIPRMRKDGRPLRDPPP